ncbi:MAG: histidine kinase [Acidimicrobiales bacterium]
MTPNMGLMVGLLTTSEPRETRDRRTIEQIDRFVRFDRAGALVGGVLAAIGNAIFIREPLVYFVLPALSALVLLLTVARQQLGAGEITRSLALITLGNWLVAVVVTFIFSFLWPVMILTTTMPLVLATPHLRARAMLRYILGAATVATSIAVLGISRDDDSAIEDIDDTFELVLITSAIFAQMTPIGLLIWHNNELQRDALDQSIDLNDELHAAQGELAAERERLVESRRRVVEAGDFERSRIERDLHDGAQQRLAALGMRLRMLASQSTTSAEQAVLAGLVTELEEATDELRDLAHGIYPPLLANRGLGEAITAVVRRSPVSIELNVASAGRYDPGVEAALYFTVLEALSNIHKYCPDSSVVVSLAEEQSSTLVLRIIDDGPGFEQGAGVRGKGLLNMADRIASLDGRLAVSSQQGGGTSITATVPEPKGPSQ